MQKYDIQFVPDTDSTIKMVGDYAFIDYARTKFKLFKKIFKRKRTPTDLGYFKSPVLYVDLEGRFPEKMLKKVCSVFKEQYINYSIDDAIKKRFKSSLVLEIPSNIEGIEYRDYQLDALMKMCQHNCGIIEVGTGGGKSIIFSGFCKTVLDKNPNAKILITAPGKYLPNQIHDTLTSCGLKSQFYNGGDIKENIVVSNHEYLTYDMDRVHLFSNFDVVISDECHSTSGTNIGIFIDKIPTFHKYGFTATIPDDDIGCRNVLNRFGDPIYTKTADELRKAGAISQARIRGIKLLHSQKPKFDIEKDYNGDTNAAYRDEKAYLYNKDERNKVVAKLASKIKDNVVIIVNEWAQGDSIIKHLEDLGQTVYKISGDVCLGDRGDIIELLEKDGANIKLVAQDKTFSTGVSVNNIKHIFFPSLGKRKSNLVQKIGRALRLHYNKTVANIYDFYDNTFFSALHYYNRKKIYKLENIEVTEYNVEI